MELTKIEELLEKYFEATTTIAEEKALKAYFSKDVIAPHLIPYQSIFTHFTKAKDDTFTKNVSLKSKNNTYKWMSIAAVIMLLFGIYFLQPKKQTLEAEYTQEEIASAQEALKLLAFNFKKGSQQINYLEEFEKNTNKFLK